MISNYNQILILLNLLKHTIRTFEDREMDSFKLSNFKFHKLYPFSKQKLVFFMKSEEISTIFNRDTFFYVLEFKFYYNLKFDVFSVLKTKEFLVLVCKTSVFGNSNSVEFDKNLILGGLHNDQ